MLAPYVLTHAFRLHRNAHGLPLSNRISVSKVKIMFESRGAPAVGLTAIDISSLIAASGGISYGRKASPDSDPALTVALTSKQE